MSTVNDADDVITCLVVDDDPELRTLLCEILLSESHLAVAAESAEAALQLLPLYPFDVAFLDHQLPGLDGLLLGSFLRKHHPLMPIALVTGQSDPKVQSSAEDASLVYISKPFQLREITEVVRRAIAARELSAARCGTHLAIDPRSITEAFEMPSIPDRVQRVLRMRLQSALHAIDSSSTYSEAERSVSLAGLLSASTLGLKLPRWPDGSTWFEVYDRACVREAVPPQFARNTND